MERRNLLAVMGTTAFAALARRMGLPTVPDNPKATKKCTSHHTLGADVETILETRSYDRWPSTAALSP
jgi:hypothetical protein